MSLASILIEWGHYQQQNDKLAIQLQLWYVIHGMYTVSSRDVRMTQHSNRIKQIFGLRINSCFMLFSMQYHLSTAFVLS